MIHGEGGPSAEEQDAVARYGEWADHAPVKIWATRPDGYCVFLNRRWYEFTGQTEAEALGYGWLEATHPDDRAEVERTFREANAARAPFSVEYRLRRKDGTYRWSLDLAQPRFGPDGEYQGYVGAVYDVSERKAATEVLEKSERRLRGALDIARLGAFEWNLKTNVMALDGRSRELFGFGPDEAVTAEALFGRVEEADLARVRSEMDRSVAEGSRLETEYRIRRPDGTGRAVTCLSDVTRGPDGTATQTVGVFGDVTERRDTERMLGESEERYRSLFNSMDEGFCVIEMVWEGPGRPRDYRIIEFNPAFTQLTGITQEMVGSGQTVRQIFPTLEEYWFETYGRVARTGEAVRFEQAAEPMGRQFDVYATRIGGEGSDRVGVLFSEVTARRRAERERERLVAELVEERAKLRNLFELAPALVAVLRGPDLTFDYVNPAFYQVVGHRPVEGMPLAQAMPELVGGPEGQDYDRLLRSILDSGKPVTLTERSVWLQRTRGAPLEERFLDLAYLPIFEEGRATAVMAHGMDVTDGVRARQAIAQSEEQFRTVFENAPDDAILLMDADRTVTAWNPAAERMLGWTAAEAVGRAADVIFTSEDRAEKVPETEAETAAREGKAADERWHVRRDGTRFWGSGTMNALYGPGGEVRGFLKVFRDATARHEMERRLQRLNDELEERVAQRTEELVAKNQELEGFTYSVSHDMRAPLRAIIANAHITLEEERPRLSEEGQASLERLSAAALRMGRLVDDLLQYARLGTREMHREPVALAKLCRQVANEVREDRPDCVLHLTVQGEVTVEADPRLIGMALHNLLDNACKYHKPGEEATVEFRCERTDGMVACALRDEGIGFDPRYEDKLFTPFERLHRNEVEGTGIGLANVKRAIERHGGQVWAEGEPGVGATFRFTLPARDGAR